MGFSRNATALANKGAFGGNVAGQRLPQSGPAGGVTARP
jgi:hypothetical protein